MGLLVCSQNVENCQNDATLWQYFDGIGLPWAKPLEAHSIKFKYERVCVECQKNALRAILRRFYMPIGKSIMPWNNFPKNGHYWTSSVNQGKLHRTAKRTDSLLRVVHNLRWTASASYLNLVEYHQWNDMLIIANGRIYANSCTYLFMPLSVSPWLPCRNCYHSRISG